MLINKANLIPKVATLIHNRQRFPLACLDVDLFNIGRESTAEATSENNHAVGLWAEAGAITKREFQLNLQALPFTILDTVSFYCVEAILSVIATKSIYELVVHDSC